MSNATTYRLSFRTVTAPDLSGFKWYTEAGCLFDAHDYSHAYGIEAGNIDPQDVHAAQDAAGHLTEGEWLEVTHEAETV